MKKMLKNKTILVTGSGSGIGRATALAVATEGGNVIVNDINPIDAKETVELIKDKGGNAIFIEANVANSEEVKQLIKSCVKKYGRLDGAYNNAGIAQPTSILHEITEDDWNRVIAINLKGVFLCMKFEIEQMINQGVGSIVNCSSIAGILGWREESAYTAAKYGVIGLTKCAAAEYGAMNIRINAVCPGVISTAMSKYQDNDPGAIKKMYAIPMQRRGDMNEVAETVIWLLSDKSSYTTGHALVLDGGFSACLGPNASI